MFEDFLNVSGCNIANSLLFQAILGTNIVKLLNENVTKQSSSDREHCNVTKNGDESKNKFQTFH